MKIVVFGLSLSSSWGNGHATTYRALLSALACRGHEIMFLERDQPWYAAARDLPAPGFCRLAFYRSVRELRRWAGEVARADLVMIGSYVTEGVAVARWVRAIAGGVFAFYDIDTPVTLAKLASGNAEYLSSDLIPAFDLYLSFTGGPTLETLRTSFGARRPRPLYCAFDPEMYRPTGAARRWDLGYLGTYSADRQTMLEELLCEPARRRPDLRFVVAGPQYPAAIVWPENVERIEHVPPEAHAEFYSSLGWALNVTRADMKEAGYSPSVRLFEAAACACPILSDPWRGIAEVLRPGREIMLADSTRAAMVALAMDPDRRIAIGQAARRRVGAMHTSLHRARQLETYVAEARASAPAAALAG